MSKNKSKDFFYSLIFGCGIFNVLVTLCENNLFDNV